MDCCGMPMAVRPGGGLMCRRCGSAVDVPVVVRGNRCSAACGVRERMVVEVVNRAPLVAPPPPGFEAEVDDAVSAPEAALVSFPAGLSDARIADLGNPQRVYMSEDWSLERVLDEPSPIEDQVSFPDNVEQPKVSGFGRRGRKGGAK